MARCKNCYLEIQPGDKICRRCNSPVDGNPLLSWQVLLLALVCAVAVSGTAFYILRR
jgi:hypothetical protein